MTTIDFDSFRKEQAGEPVNLILGGKTYPLPTSLPAALALDIVRLNWADEGAAEEAKPEDMLAIGAGLFGGEAQFITMLRDAGVGMNELGELIQQVIQAYDVTPPNPEAPAAE